MLVLGSLYAPEGQCDHDVNCEQENKFQSQTETGKCLLEDLSHLLLLASFASQILTGRSTLKWLNKKWVNWSD